MIEENKEFHRGARGEATAAYENQRKCLVFWVKLAGKVTVGGLESQGLPIGYVIATTLAQTH